MNIEGYQRRMSQRLNYSASRLLARKVETSPVNEITVHNTGVLDNPANRYIIGLFGPHKTTFDSAILASAVQESTLERSLTLLSRPADRDEPSAVKRAIHTAKQQVSPLLHPIYTTRDTSIREIESKNMRSFAQLVKYHRRVSPSIVFIAPDGGSSPNEKLLEPRFTKGWGTLMLIAAFLNEGVTWDELAIVPVGIRRTDNKATVVFGENLTPAMADMYTASTNTQPWMDRELTANLSQGIVSSINQLLI